MSDLAGLLTTLQKSYMSMEKEGFLVLNEQEAADLGSKGHLVKEVDTFTSGFIRVFTFDSNPGKFYVEEQNIDDKMFVWRELESMEVVDAFIKNREENYAMMWGSCCAGKIGYCEKFQA
ncbi:hypothetical protein HDU76_000613 [Blyttiomyces sp. JEL0837]|nr:hypothetical protein HDU76_000613 [Blyttiomyces sp. JEL0837]